MLDEGNNPYEAHQTVKRIAGKRCDTLRPIGKTAGAPQQNSLAFAAFLVFL